ncbi:hypothetical protein STRIC_1686 [Streptococcus ictaluri 707-05]|uniref:Uncharacterized protein n=1 Tax=Streptococcus ictaluri 707-05 TaxID=764299 RepID=G5K4G4_9STRE|nr:hypothetical protein STRIC_1686 [Streptococcus ictaluri 707-05]
MRAQTINNMILINMFLPQNILVFLIESQFLVYHKKKV